MEKIIYKNPHLDPQHVRHVGSSQYVDRISSKAFIYLLEGDKKRIKEKVSANSMQTKLNL